MAKKILTVQLHDYETPAGICRICLCTHADACYNDVMDNCSWYEPNLCSHCKVMIDQIDNVKNYLQKRKKIQKRAGNID